MGTLTPHPRPATEADALGIARVQVDSWRTAYKDIMDRAILDSLDPGAKQSTWSKFITASDQGVFVVESHGNIIGYAHACKSRDEPGSSVGEIGSMYVVPAHWRKGLGHKLLSTAEEWLCNRGYHAITLWVLEKNLPALLFYERFGYTSDGVSKTHPSSRLTELRYRKMF